MTYRVRPPQIRPDADPSAKRTPREVQKDADDRATNRYLHERQALVDRVIDTQVLPPGGTDGQVLTKASDNDYDVDWETPGGGIASPLTTKGDIWGYSTTDARIPVGADGKFLKADSTQALGVKWDTPAGGSSNGYYMARRFGQ